MISVVLVIAPDGKDSNRLAFDRIKANILGSAVGLLLFLIRIPPTCFLICLGVIPNHCDRHIFEAELGPASCPCSLNSVMIHEEGQNSTWHIALERMGCVMIGCIIGLLITLAFNAFLI